MAEAHRWSHPICDRCWRRMYPDRTPVRIRGEYRGREDCCWCGKPSHSGIYFREDPTTVPAHR